jgi:murein tripeptide amidase MpaA
MTDYQPDQYYRYDEMTDWLRSVADRHPDLVELRSIGTSPEGREIWLAAVTDRSTGEADAKPAYWIDGNTHAAEVMGSAAALYTIDYLVTHADETPLAELLATTALYIVPRVNPDGAEWCLETGRFVRSARRLYPEQKPRPGFVEQDVDGDGEVLQMRVEDPQGAWKVSEADSRILVPREPWDCEGPFYRLYAEGRFDEQALEDPRRPVRGDPHGLDFNRNYPYGWAPERDQSGAGDYPLSEPETRAVADFLTEHRNVFGALSYHTFSGVLLRPFSDRPDREMPDLDLAVYELLGDRCEERTGFEAASTYHDFNYDEGSPISGAFDDWAYNHLGVHAFTFELWSPWREAGLDFTDDYLRFFGGRTEEENLALLEWNDEALDGEGFVDWRSFDHPQLGEVEIGGWRWMYTWRNAPTERLEEECRGACLFSLDHARCGPKPVLELDCERVDEGRHRLTARMENRGYLPTAVTEHARDEGIVRPLHLELDVEGELSVEQGDRRRRIEHLEGYADITKPNHSAFTWTGETRGHVREAEWLVRGDGEVEVTWSGDRIGRLSARQLVGSDENDI